MRKLSIIALAASLFVLTVSSQAANVDCRATPIGERFGDEPVVLLAAAGTLFPETRPLADAALGSGWWLTDPANLSRQVVADSVRVGVDRLCSWLQSLPAQRRRECVWKMAEWKAGYRTVEVLLWLLGVEALGSAIAQCPDTRSFFPRDEQVIANQGSRVGESLASGENVRLWYALASFLGSQREPDRARIVTELLQLGSGSLDMKR